MEGVKREGRLWREEIKAEGLKIEGREGGREGGKGEGGSRREG